MYSYTHTNSALKVLWQYIYVVYILVRKKIIKKIHGAHIPAPSSFFSFLPQPGREGKAARCQREKGWPAQEREGEAVDAAGGRREETASRVGGRGRRDGQWPPF
jgi:hypothetical protein